MTHSTFVLRGRVIVPVTDSAKWHKEFFRSNRVVALTSLGPVNVATTFLGVAEVREGLPPLLFCTRIVAYGDKVLNGREWRNANIVDAEACHKEAVTLVKERQGR